ncbi:MAG: hypothetical protein IKX98_03970 [Clostridia bacterium]|nr:hypothetical protein [Clostridia bacterium]
MSKDDRNIKAKVAAELFHAVIALLVSAALAAPAVIMKQPLLSMLPVAGVTALAAFFGNVAGVVAAVVSSVCAAYTLSGGFTAFSPEGICGLLAMVFASVVSILFISRLRRLYKESQSELASVRAERPRDEQR